MKSLKAIITGLVLLLFLYIQTGNCQESKHTADKDLRNKANAGAPPKTWQEHWFAHKKLLKLVFYDHDLALYYDNGMDTSIHWNHAQFAASWRYIKKNYGEYGDSSRLYVICHGIPPNGTAEENSYGGGHPSPYYDPSHDYRNTIDCGLGANDWEHPTGDAIRQPIHEMAHIVASSSYGMIHDISSDLWSDSKFAEIFIYDVLLNIGRADEASQVLRQMQTQYDDFPAPRTQWFKNWFYPIYGKYGKGAILARYFRELSKNVHDRSEGLNLGEFVHFFSGAAGTDLSGQASIAFGKAWDEQAKAQFKKAQSDYPKVKYKRS